jgi:C-terminal processing protease CtpA/Prc
MKTKKFLFPLFTVMIAALGCATFSTSGTAPVSNPTSAGPEPTVTRTLQLVIPTTTGGANEPVVITGDIPYTSPFFLNSTSEPFIMLEDEAGFVKRDKEFRFSLQSQTIGPVILDKDKKLTYFLALPEVPQATQLDVDNNGKTDPGVQIFQVAYWSNTWGGPFLEDRDGKGWSTAYTSAITDPEKHDEIVGGILVVWAPDDKQGFPTGFGPDGKLFTADDPTAPILAGYSLVDLNKEPFRIYKESHPQITLNEGAGAVKDYSSTSYSEAFDALFKKASVEYPFTKEKGINWDALYQQSKPNFDKASTAEEFYTALREFINQIPDGHVGVTLDRNVFYANYGGGFGLVLTLLSDQSIVVSDVLTGKPGDTAGIQRGAQILTWDGMPVMDAVKKVVPGFGPYSADHTRLLAQVTFLTHVPPDTKVDVKFKNPGGQEKTVTMRAVAEYDSLFKTIPSFNQDSLELPITAKTLSSGIGYIRVNTLNDDYNMMARLWDRYMNDLVDNNVPALIIDLRANSGGSSGLAMDFTGYFFDKEIKLYDTYYYNSISGQFEASGYPTFIKPAPLYYKGPIAVLVSSDCVSACEGFAYALQQNQRSIVVGNYPSSGAYGEVGLGQYKLPDNLSMQFPTGRSVTPDGQVVIEGKGVVPDITVPVTLDSVLGTTDTLLESAIQALQKQMK